MFTATEAARRSRNACYRSEVEVAKKTAKRVKHVPQRTCVGCKEILPKRTLVRVVRTPEGLRIDPTGKTAGRGAYLHDRRSCWERGLKGALAHALKVEITDQDREVLREFMNTLPAVTEVTEGAPADAEATEVAETTESVPGTGRAA